MRRGWGSTALAATIMLVTLAPVVAVLLRSGEAGLQSGDLGAVRFTLLQAMLSALLSTVLAVPVARALARRRFAGRGVLIALFGAPFLLPVVVAVLGLLALFGRSGLVNAGLTTIGLPEVRIYGLHGVVLAHVFLNLPLAVRMLLHGWEAIPGDRLRLAAALDFDARAMWRHIEVPMLRAVLPGAALVIFVLCLTSFAVALTLGGGPAATTVELAIYQAVRFDFALPRAAVLSLVQLALCGLALMLAAGVTQPGMFGAGSGRRSGFAPGGWRRAGDAAVLTFAAVFLIVPLGLVMLRGLPGLADLPAGTGAAAMRSLVIAAGSGLLATGCALVLALAAARGQRGATLAATLPLATSSLVLGTGLFLIVNPFMAPSRLALPVTLGVNAALALPFVFRLLLPEARTLREDYGRLSDALGLEGLARLRWVTLPRLARPLGYGAGLAMALSMGDLGVIALFAGEAEATLPLMVQRLMAAYRMEAAAAVALLLVALGLVLFWLCDHAGRRVAAA